MIDLAVLQHRFSKGLDNFQTILDHVLTLSSKDHCEFLSIFFLSR